MRELRERSSQVFNAADRLSRAPEIVGTVREQRLGGDGRSCIVDARRVGASNKDRRAALNETVKFVAEESKTRKILVDDDDLRHVSLALKGTKFHGTFGSLFAAEHQLPDGDFVVECPVCGSRGGWTSPWLRLSDGEHLGDTLGWG